MVALNAIFGASATGSMGVQIPVPANVAAAKHAVGVGIGDGITTPSGFTDLFTSVADTPNMRVFHKRATGADSGTYNAGGGLLATNDGIAWKLNGENTGPPWIGALICGVRRVASSTTPTFSIPGPGQGVMLVWITRSRATP